MGNEKRLRISLLLLRLGVFVVMFVWTLDKFVAPDHAARVFDRIPDPYPLPQARLSSTVMWRTTAC